MEQSDIKSCSRNHRYLHPLIFGQGVFVLGGLERGKED